jgi:hypothetical protein
MDEARRRPFGGRGSASIAAGVVSCPQVLVPRLESSNELWRFSNSPVDRAPTLALPTLRLSSAVEIAPHSNGLSNAHAKPLSVP